MNAPVPVAPAPQSITVDPTVPLLINVTLGGVKYQLMLTLTPSSIAPGGVAVLIDAGPVLETDDGQQINAE